MFKFLRRYNKWILAVGGTLLMITFLIPQAIQSLSQRAALGSATWATAEIDGEIREVSGEVQRTVVREMQVLQQLGALQRDDPPAHWYLLTKEAEDAGMVGGWSTGYRQLPEPVEDNLQRLATATRESPEFILKTLARLDGVIRMLSQYRSAAKFSQRRLKSSAASLFHGARIRTVVIEARADESLPMPTDQEIRQQYEAYRDVPPGEGERGFGYRLPDRLKLEWLTVTDDSVRRMIEQQWQANRAQARIELRKHWHLNQDNPGFPRVEEASSAAEIPGVVREDLLKKRTAETLDEIARFGDDELIEPRRGLPQQDIYVETPADWEQTRLAFAQLAERIRDEFDVELPGYQAIGDRWLAIDEIEQVDALDDIAAASTDKYGTQPIRLPALLRAARQFGGRPGVPVQERVAGPALRDDAGNVYFFRITAAEPSWPPESVDEVRDKVVADLRRLADYRRMTESLAEIRAQAAEGGLLALALARDTVVRPQTTLRLADPQQFQILLQLGIPPAIEPTPLPGIGVNRDVAQQIIDFALTLPPGPNVARLPAEQRTIVVPADEVLSVLVAQVVDQVPVTEEDFVQYVAGGFVQQVLLNEELGDADLRSGPFSLDSLMRRHSFEYTVGQGTATAPDTTTTPAS